MKKVFVLMLVVAGKAPLYAQFIDINSPKSMNEIIFNNPKPKTLRNNFDFLLPYGNKMTLEFSNIAQFNMLVNVDSLVRKVWLDLYPLHDSLKKPLLNRRVDFNINEGGSQIRIIEYPQQGSTFKYLDDELVQTKVEQDTLRIRISTPRFATQQSIINFSIPYFIMLKLNNISDIPALPPGLLNAAVGMLRKDIAPGLKKKQTQDYRTYFAIYDVAKQKRISPLSTNNFGFGKKKYLEPYVQLGLQYLRGSWVPSAGAGLQIIHGYYNANREMFKLYWEPYFFFSRNASNNLITQRNDFITFKYNEVRQRPNNFPTVNLNFSAGYLVGRRGNWFEPYSFKFAVPGFTMHNITIEPEFHFNKLFKNFSPSLRLTLDIE